MVATLPGVRSVSLSAAGLLGGDILRTRFSIDGYVPQEGENLQVSAVVVGPRFFKTLRIPLLRGGELTTADISSPPKIVISESMARHYFGTPNAIGLRYGIARDEGTPIEVVGIVREGSFFIRLGCIAKFI